MTTPDPAALPRAADFDAAPEAFNPAAWLNALPELDPQPLQEALSVSLDHAHRALDQSLQRSLSAIPWVVRETERIRQRANLLRTNVDGVGVRVAGVEHGVVSSVKTIADADLVVRRVQTTVQLLQTAVRCEALLDRLDALLASAGGDGADLVAAADVVAQLRESLAPLETIPELDAHRARLQKADKSLQELAAPQLRSALEARNAAAARNARIVFDHAGRGDAFREQYGALRGAEIRAAWGRSWRRDGPDDSRGAAGDLAGVGAAERLALFYEDVGAQLQKEGLWLRDAFPDLADLLLPGVVCRSVDELVPRPVVNVFGEGDIGNRLFDVGECAIRATAKIGRSVLPPSLGGKEDGDGDGNGKGSGDGGDDGENASDAELLKSIVDAITALLMPHRKFWDVLGQVAVRHARTRASAISLPSGSPGGGSGNKRPALSDLARDVTSASKEAVSIVEELLTTLNTRTCGVGIDAMKQAATTVASVLSDRLLRLLRLPPGSDGDEWTRVSGALRLLIATGTLKRAWDTRKESSFAVAVGTATPVLEVASLVQDEPAKRIEQFLGQVDAGDTAEAGTVWELVRDDKLSSRVVAAFESLDSTNDFQGLVDAVHRIVYETMFDGVKERFASFSGSELWSSSGGDGDGALLGISSSPLGYATEVADYLMTIPQQLEPFVPEEDDAKYAMPRSPYAFCKAGAAERLAPTRRGDEEGDNADGDGDGDGDGDEDMRNLSFAGMWIGALCIGTMELCVEKVCSVTRLSESGTRQLATDVDYISSVIASLGVGATGEMEVVCRLLECRGEAQAFADAARGYESGEQRKLVRRVAAVRGINVTL